jgi:hypothetical protein
MTSLRMTGCLEKKRTQLHDHGTLRRHPRAAIT